MKKLIAAAGIGAALAIVPLAVAGAANASTGSFVSSLSDEGWYNAVSGSAGLLNQGYQVCNFLYQGYSESSVVNWVYWNTGDSVSWAEAGQFVATAENHLC